MQKEITENWQFLINSTCFLKDKLCVWKAFTSAGMRVLLQKQHPSRDKLKITILRFFLLSSIEHQNLRIMWVQEHQILMRFFPNIWKYCKKREWWELTTKNLSNSRRILKIQKIHSCQVLSLNCLVGRQWVPYLGLIWLGFELTIFEKEKNHYYLVTIAKAWWEEKHGGPSWSCDISFIRPFFSWFIHFCVTF